MKKKIGLVITLVILGSLLFIYIIPDNITFNFSFDGSDEYINGDVYFEDIQTYERIFLGRTYEGTLDYPKQDIYQGNIIFISEYQGNPFEFYYELFREDLDYGEVNYIITNKNIIDLEFELTNKDLEIIKNEAINLMNFERENKNIVKLIRNEKLDNVAQKYSERMISENFYAHTDPNGKDCYDRLNTNGIFYYTAAENLGVSYVDSNTSLPEEIVYGWINSPGHRIPILDTNKHPVWDNVGIGIGCDKLNQDEYYTCYYTAIFAGFESEYSDILKSTYIQAINLYDVDLGLNFPSDLKISFSSDHSVDLYIVPEYSQFEDFLYGRSKFNPIITKKRIKEYNEIITTYPGYTLLIDSSPSNKAINYSLKVESNI